MRFTPIANTMLIGAAMLIIHGFGSGCGDVSTSTADISNRQFPLDELDSGTITIAGNTIPVWVMKNSAQRNEGLMHVSDEDMPDNQGMLFVFDNEQILSFWMRNTYIPLDIAYARTDGTIVTIDQMEPLNLIGVSSILPARFALEMKAGTLERLGIQPGDRMVIPLSLLE